MTCIFCDKENLEIVVENKLALAIFDKFPVNRGHMLIIPKRHFQNFFDATEEEIVAIYDLLHQCKGILENKYSPDGYNIGINVNEDAGQTIMHLHVHIIPRCKGDVEKPRGGIRNLKTPLVPY
ncbi:MAG: HIT family protein [Clostridiaceae bacterium]|nr:HIT family protein [Clostridiaceae bacterium]